MAAAGVRVAAAAGGLDTAPPGVADDPTSGRPNHGRAPGRAKPEKGNPNAGVQNGAANGHGNGNGPGNNNGKALGKTNQPPALPPTAQGRGTPAGGKSTAPGQSKQSEPAAPAAPPAPPEHAKAIGFGKDKPAKGQSD
jgi:hypothetical protein